MPTHATMPASESLTLLRRGSASFSTERYGDIARMRVKNAQLVILKPSTYMNLSGNAVRYWKEKKV